MMVMLQKVFHMGLSFRCVDLSRVRTPNVIRNLGVYYYMTELTVSANMILPSGDCTMLGNSKVASMDITPYKDGFMLSYYHGDYVNNIQSQMATIYLICNTANVTPYFEHEKSFHDFHLRYDNKYVCSVMDELLQ
eukprot:TRINITY_DN580_c0_g1_i3.p2 TRINITY_DN580_c0_g1~~TRINITY_DN580_c0_g1_i3.p2  ORF type:complete len:135 (-),score=9.15 TRINITY_DN580_c0_g1_i3:6-410(-)